MDTLPPDVPLPIGHSPAFLGLMEQVSRVAPLDRPVLVVGERGTGKELIATRLHFLSARWDGPLIKLDCAALPESLLEAELFGHEAGAFTGAVRRRLGRFELADGGSIFLDEIANASLEAQQKVLRVSEYGEFERLGAATTRRVDVRIIGATNVDLPAAAAAGRFRLDLLDRLAFDVLTVPPLRARQGDILLLAEHFARAFARELGYERFAGFAPAARDALTGHSWPGNVRELKNTVERAVYRAADPTAPVAEVAFDPFASPFRPGHTTLATPATPTTPVTLVPSAIPDETAEAADRPRDFRATVGAFERRLLEQALQINRYNQRATARHLGLSYDQLRNQLRKHALS